MIGILIVTHGEIGKSLIDCATHMLDDNPSSLDSLSINSNNDLSQYTKVISQKIKELDKYIESSIDFSSIFCFCLYRRERCHE